MPFSDNSNSVQNSGAQDLQNIKEFFTPEFMQIIQNLHNLFYGQDPASVKDKTQKFEQEIYWRLAKLMEESGELAEAIHAYFNHQRKSKDKDGTLGSKEHVAEEVVDVMIVVVLLAPMFGIDLNKTLEKKFKKIRQRMIEKYGVDISNT